MQSTAGVTATAARVLVGPALLVGAGTVGGRVVGAAFSVDAVGSCDTPERTDDTISNTVLRCAGDSEQLAAAATNA
jgi:hypothetical protein